MTTKTPFDLGKTSLRALKAAGLEDYHERQLETLLYEYVAEYNQKNADEDYHKLVPESLSPERAWLIRVSHEYHRRTIEVVQQLLVMVKRASIPGMGIFRPVECGKNNFSVKFQPLPESKAKGYINKNLSKRIEKEIIGRNVPGNTFIFDADIGFILKQLISNTPVAKRLPLLHKHYPVPSEHPSFEKDLKREGKAWANTFGKNYQALLAHMRLRERHINLNEFGHFRKKDKYKFTPDKNLTSYLNNYLHVTA